MLHQAGGGGKGNRPAQQQPQQLNQHQLTISQLQLHPGQQALHQANQTGHSIHAVQQQQLSSAPLHLGHQTQTQNLSHYQHPQQNQQQAPQPQLAHPSQSFLILNQPPPLPQSNNGTPGPQLASSPPLQNSSTPHTTTQSGGQIQCYGNNNSINHTNNTGNIGRQQSATNNTGNIQYAGNTNIIPAHGPGFMTTTFHMPYQQAPPPASVMAATIYANNAAPVGNHNANTTQNTSQQALFTAAQHQPQQPHGMPPAQALQYFPGNISVPNTQMRGVLTHRSYVMPPFFAFPTGPRAQLLSNSHQQPGVGQVLQTATRGPMGTTTAYIQPYCQPPIPMCTPQSPIIPQPPTASSSLQTYSTHMQASNAIGAASSSNTSINSLNSNTEIVKPRKHAIPIINPDTMVSIFEEKPRRQSTSTETSPDTLKKSKDDSGINIEENTIASDSLLTSTEQTEASLLADSSADDYEQHLQNELSVDSNMNQTSYEEKSTFTVSSSPAVSNISATEEEYDDNTSICSQTTSNTKLNSDKQTEDYTIEFEDEHITVVVEEVPVESSTNIVEDEVDNICSFSDVKDPTSPQIEIVKSKKTKAVTKELTVTQNSSILKKSNAQEFVKTELTSVVVKEPKSNEGPRIKILQREENQLITTKQCSKSEELNTLSNVKEQIQQTKKQSSNTEEDLPQTVVSTTKVTSKRNITIMQRKTLTASMTPTPSTSSSASPIIVKTLPDKKTTNNAKTNNAVEDLEQTATDTSQSNKSVSTKSLKKNRKAAKRAREAEAKNKKNERNNLKKTSENDNNNNQTVQTVTTTTAKLQNNNNQNQNQNKANAKKKNQTNNVSCDSGPSCPDKTANKRQQPQQHEQNQQKKNKRTGDEQQKVERNDGRTNNKPKPTKIESDAPVKNKLLNNDEIVAKYLQPDLNATQGEADHNYEFLNKSVSPGEDEEELSARLLLHEQQYAMDTHAELKAIRFGDFSEDKDSDELSETKSIIDNTTNAVFSNIKNNMPTSAEYNRNRNSSDVTINDKIIKRNLEFKIGFGRVEGGADKPLQTNISYKSDGTTKSLTRYSMDELRTISKSAQSRKPPVINFPPGSCISQLFVSRHNHSNNQHQSNNMHQHVHQQQYQHMNFNESIEFLSGKRRTQNKKHDNTSNSANSHATSSSSMNSQNQRKMDIIHVNLSLNEEIKLSECENAWQPDSIRSKSIKSHSSPNDDIDAVLKKVRGVLNKLTPDNFDVLLKSMSNISIDTQEKMHQVIILIFEKTISEPNFAPTYAKFCKVLFHETTIDSKALITRIQNEFETNVNDAHAKKLKLQPLVEKLEKCEDPKERIELQAEIENQEYQFRRRAWGTVRFIGEIYKLQSLGSDRVLICIESLLEHGSEEKLEYMCKLLTTVGHLLEGKATEHKLRLDKIFRKINDIVNKSRNNNNNKKQEKISSRVRFMMQDVMDLRARNWDQPYTDKQRRTPTKQQQQQHLTEKVQNKSNATNLINSNRSVGYNSQNNSRHSRGIDNQRDNNYFASNKQKLNYVQQNEQIDMNKLKFTRNEDTTLGCSSMCLWKIHGRAPTSVNTNSTTLTNNASTSASASGSTHTTDSNVRRTTNPFQILDNLDNNRTTSQSSVGSSCSSTNSSNCGYNNKECQRIINGLVEEILDGNSGWGQEVLNIWQTANRFQQTSLLQYILIEYLHLADTKRTQREACAKIFIHLIPNKKIFDKKVFTTAYNEFAEEFPDLLVDVPNGWSYIFEFLGSILHERLLHLDDIWNSQWDNNGPKFAERFLKALVVYFTNEFGANYMYDMWHKEFKLDRAQRFFSDESDWDRFIKANSFQYIAERNYKIPQAVRVNKSHNITTAEQVERIEYLLNTANECDLAIDYINTNVIINSTFIKNLTKCLCCDFSTVIQTNNNNTSSGTATSSITTSNTPKKTKKSQHKRQLNTELFRSKCTPLLRLCIDMREEYEIACLDAIVDALQQAYEDSTTANDLICSVFEILYESEIIPKDSYEKWYQIRKSAGASTSSPTNSNIRSGTNKEKDKNAGSNRQAHNKQQHTNNNSKNRNNRLSDEIYTYIKKLL
ncbi:eukaryotic translation initiation factor 4 gamma-like isoform X1 [Teleopsis dalmanni]|uniref:eukaryotic translation initiation factor 4 gamma-like isoform X1 n=1 Tax=Teleopsis dalmanni TaxID=139649 RepID=UPI0018CE2C5A|nr:eukaryotic translation initiation factor 4 gamma-like isoform X1 [Teleopsis dalmanni]